MVEEEVVVVVEEEEVEEDEVVEEEVVVVVVVHRWVWAVQHRYGLVQHILDRRRLAHEDLKERHTPR